MIKLIVTDMDGTLLNKKEEVNPEFLEVFKELKDNNILFAVASGRQKKNLELKFSEIKNELVMLFENGSCGFLEGNALYRSELNKIIVHKLIDIGRKNSHNMLLCTEDMTYIENVNEEFITELKKYYENITFVNDLKEIDKPIIKYTVFDPNDAKENSFEIYDGLLQNRVKISISGTKWLHIVEKNTGKGFGVKALQKHFNITAEETMVFGDSNNDLDMIKSAYYSYAMENASEELKEAAKFIAPSNEENGVLKVIKKEVLENLHKEELKETTPILTVEPTNEVMVEEKNLETKPKKKAATTLIIEESTSITKKASEKKSVKEKAPVKKETLQIKKIEESDDEFFEIEEEKHPFDDESLEEKLLAILG